MTRLSFHSLVALSALLISMGCSQSTKPKQNIHASDSTNAEMHIARLLSRLPLSFEKNEGQANSDFQFLSHFQNGQIVLTEACASIQLISRDGVSVRTVSLEPLSENRFSHPAAADPLPGTVNYLRGRSKKGWLTGIRTFSKIKYSEVYPGVDMVFYGTKENLEYDFVLTPKADPSQIAFRFSGIDGLDLDEQGNLRLQLGNHYLLVRAPKAFQRKNDTVASVESQYQLRPDGSVGFRIGTYDRTQELIIDPLVEFSTYLGGNSSDAAYAIAIDSTGSAYITGYTGAPDFPVSGNAFDTTRNGFFSDAIVTKINPTTGSILYSTYLGGTGFEEGFGIAVDSTGTAFVVGRTTSTDFPTVGPIQANYGGQQDGVPGYTDGDGFVVRLSAAGDALIYSTYLGGSRADEARAVALDGSGNAYVTGNTASSNFPIVGALQTTFGGMPSTTGGTPANGDAFLAKLNAQGSALVYSSYLGGSGNETGRGIAVDDDNFAYIAGSTSSDDFPTKNPLQSNRAGQTDAFVARLNADGGSSSYATYLGGTSAEDTYGLAVDAQRHAYVVGTTYSSNFPVRKPLQGSQGGLYDGFLTKLSESGSSIEFSTYLGGSLGDEAFAVTVDANGFPYVAGTTKSADFPLKDAAQATLGTDSILGVSFDAFVLQLRPNGSELIYSTFVGGSFVDTGYGVGVDSSGRAHLVGTTFSNNFPLAHELQSSLSLGQDAFFTTVGAGTISNNMSISTIYPTSGGDRGTVSVLIRGANLFSISSAVLSANGASEIVADNVVAADDGTSVAAEFDLFGETLGERNLILTSSSGNEISKAQAFTIEKYNAGRLWVSIAGRSVVRTGRPTKFTVTYGNDSNNDVKGLPLWIWGSPDTATLVPDFPTGPLPAAGGEEGWDEDPVTSAFDNSLHLPLLIPLIPASGSGALDISTTFQSNGPFTLNAVLRPPFFKAQASAPASSAVHPLDRSTDVFIDTAYACIGGVYDLMVSKMIDKLPAGCKLVTLTKEGIEKAMGLAVPDDLLNRVSARDTERVSQAKLFKKVAQLSVDCEDGKSGFLRAFDLGDFANKAAQTIAECKKASEGCNPGEFCNPDAGDYYNGPGKGGGHRPSQGENDSSEDSHSGESKSSVDPNEKAGPVGASSKHYINNDNPLNYVLFFENLPAASAPAQEVRITDVLDSATLETSTVTLGAMSFGSHRVSVPPGLQSYSTEIDLRPEQNLIVQIVAAFDENTNTLSWYFRSIDPSTGDLPDDADAGFLPPNTTSPNGEGRVEFSVRPKSRLSDGKKIENSASIVFDQNAPIVTNTWSNIVDKTAPTSSIQGKKAKADGSVPLTWSGKDSTSGIREYSLLVSENGGKKYQAWKATKATKGTFQGTAGKKYRFLTSAVDKAGNIELVKRQPSKSVSVTIPRSGCTLSVSKGCRKNVSVGTSCTFTTALKTGSGKPSSNSKYRLERQVSLGIFRKAKGSATNGQGKSDITIPIKETTTFRSISGNPLCTTNAVTVKVSK